MPRRSTITRGGLALRSLASSSGALVAVGVVVLVATFAITAYPRISGGLLDAELRYSVSSAGAAVRDLQANPTGVTFGEVGDVGDGSIDATWKAMPTAMVKSRESMPAVLRAATGAGRFVGRADGPSLAPSLPRGVAGSGTATAPAASSFYFAMEANPRLRTDATLVSGSWPQPTASLPSDGPLQVVLSDASARAIGWKLGQSQAIGLSGGMSQRAVLVGTVRARDAGADYWKLDLERSAPAVTYSSDLSQTFYGSVAFVDASTWPALAVSIGRPSIDAWFPVSGGSLGVDRLNDLQGDLQHFLATPYTIGPAQPSQSLRFTTLLAGTLQDFVARTAPVNSLLAIFATGPLGTAIAVLFLGVRLLVTRRRSSLSLMSARGASPLALRLRLGLETAAAAIPGAIIGGGIALALTPGAVDTGGILTIAATGLAAPVVIAIAGGSAFVDAVGARHPLLSRTWILELLVVALAVLGVTALLQRGLGGSAEGFATDPLLVLTPLLVAFAACVITLRVYPFALRAVGRVLRRGRGATDFLGWASSMRAGTLWPMFAVVTGVSITIFSLSVGTTERSGIDAAALRAVGGDVRVTGVALSPAQVKRVAAVPGVQSTTTVQLVGTYPLEGTTATVSLYLIDAAAVARSLAALPQSQRPFAGMKATGAPSGQIDPAVGRSGRVTVQVGRTALAVQATRSRVAPGDYISAENWLVLDRATAPTLRDSALVTSVIVTLAPGANAASVSRALATIAGPDSRVIDRSAQVAAARAGPLLPGVDALTLAAVLLAALMCTAALVLTLVMNSAMRVRFVGTLRTLGFSGRQASRLIGWELGPLVLAGVIAGGLVGVALPVILLTAVDLAPVTGGAARPSLVEDPIVLAATIVAFVLVAAIATLIAVILARRVSLATILRTGARD